MELARKDLNCILLGSGFMLLCSHVFAESTFSNGRYPDENNSLITTLVEDFGRLCPFTDQCYRTANASTNRTFHWNEIPCCRTCRCEQECGNECCPDYLVASFSEPELFRMKHDPIECIYPQFRPYTRGSNNYKTPYKMVSHCSMDFIDEQETRKKCEKDYHEFNFDDSFDMLMPMTLFQKNTVTFKNMYCAICNYADLSRLLMWLPILNCERRVDDILESPNDIPGFLKAQPYCNVVFKSPHKTKLYPETCKMIINKCNMTGKWRDYDRFTEMACLSYTSLFKDQYKNVHCFMCNGHIESEVEETCEIDEIGPPLPPCEIGKRCPPLPIPFTVVLDFKSKENENTEYIADKSLLDDSCGTGAVLDAYTVYIINLYKSLDE
ncbi:hypothetical protein DPMN_182983 [Dreissena polymorpha]|uniref:Uncharacterized protein n=1 Tax=Dreissena polymorpha TaxID=45954 RepID=A0A9D4DI87_DREPO|nr:hypothetical protein DPMN_182983 [Dreissena polymorpha]